MAAPRTLDRQPADRHPARCLLQPGVDARPQAEIDRGRARLSRRGAAEQLCQCRVSEMNMTVAQTQRLAVSPYARRLARERDLPLSTLRGSGPGGRILAA